MSKKYLTLEEAAQYSHMAPKTLQTKIRLGLLPAYKPGRALLIEQSELDIFIRKAKKKFAS